VYTYDEMFRVGNLVSTIAAYCIGIGMLIMLYAVISSWRSGPKAPANPWGGKTLEWAVPNPIPLENFEVLPVVIADPYGYGEGDPTPPHWREEPQPSETEKVPVASAPTPDAGSGQE
jgi:cytochrome c oxidase subunit 1